MPSSLLKILGVGIIVTFLIAWIVNIIVERDLEEGTRQAITSVFGLVTGIVGAFLVFGTEVLAQLLGNPEFLVAAFGAIGIADLGIEVTPTMYVVGVVAIMLLARLRRDRAGGSA